MDVDQPICAQLYFVTMYCIWIGSSERSTTWVLTSYNQQKLPSYHSPDPRILPNPPKGSQPPSPAYPPFYPMHLEFLPTPFLSFTVSTVYPLPDLDPVQEMGKYRFQVLNQKMLNYRWIDFWVLSQKFLELFLVHVIS